MVKSGHAIIIVILTIMRSFVVFHTVTRSFENYMQAETGQVSILFFALLQNWSSQTNNKHAIIAYYFIYMNHGGIVEVSGSSVSLD